ncbi:MAG: 23S rRNA (adenine(2503)-C(2))-methyltransferase RlmN [Candidatus Staskawiczbacteria bacterium]|nr:23S rRNA (adenine(2503)-C(2))-methyltransferase RlmN [Candidatus Staskawiczbacteria bacterium]
MDLENLEKVLENEPKYRLKQANEAVFKNFISNWEEATFFTKDLRDKLNKECPLEIRASVLVSKKEDSVKAKITLKDGFEIETVLMRHADGRNTVCVSSQVGCPLGCLFCATGKMGLKRSLTSEEILEQVVFFDRYLKKENLHVTNVTYMGMGEPFLNYDNVLKSVKILNDYKYFNIGVRSISVSTAGIIEGIKKLSEESLHINLAISLHAPTDKLRRELMPIDKKYPLEKVLKAVEEYIEKTKRKVMFEYVLIKDVNDSDKHAEELAKIMSRHSGIPPKAGNNHLYFVNLILYNDTGVFKASDTKRVEKFREVLERLKIRYTQRYRFGDDIAAACGQFATNK